MIEELLVNLAEELTIIIVTHNLFQARRIANKTIFILSGEIIEAGSTEALFTAPEKAETKGFISACSDRNRYKKGVWPLFCFRVLVYSIFNSNQAMYFCESN